MGRSGDGKRNILWGWPKSCVLLIDRIEIHQSQPDSMTQRRLEGHTSGCNWWISIDGNFGNVSACVLFSKVA